MADLKGVQVLNDKLQELNLQIIEAKNLLHEKRKCKNVASNFINNKFVDVVGHFRKSVPAKSMFLDRQVLNIKDHWQRVHNGKWIIGFSVDNVSERYTLVNLRMAMKGGHTNNMGDMHLWINVTRKPDEPHASKRIRLNHDPIVRVPPQPQKWQAITEMPPNVTGYVIRILETPNFTDYIEERISGVILYNLKDDDKAETHQVNIPILTLNAKELATGEYLPFGARLDSRLEQYDDILPTVLTSEHTLLSVRVAQVHASLSFVQTLTEKLMFESQPTPLVFYKRCVGEHPELVGILIMLNPCSVKDGAEHTINVYARNEAQTYLLVHSLYDVLPRNTVIFTPKLLKPNSAEILNSLKREHQSVSSHLRSSADSCPFNEEPRKRESSFKFRETLSEIECTTDLLIMGQV